MKANNGQISNIDMAQMVQKAKVNANRKQVFDISLSHMANWRNTLPNSLSNEEASIFEAISSFSKVREVL